jgi:hypothetical protein
MAFSFNATEGGSASNSLCTVEFADDHLGGDLHATEWAALSNANATHLLMKQQSLVKATRRLERFEYRGTVTNPPSVQRLKHPRAGLETQDGYVYDSATIIEAMKMACAELANYYLQRDPAALVEADLKQFKHLRIAGVIEMEMRDRLPSEEDIPASVRNLISPFLASGPNTIRIVRG